MARRRGNRERSVKEWTSIGSRRISGRGGRQSERGGVSVGAADGNRNGADSLVGEMDTACAALDGKFLRALVAGGRRQGQAGTGR